MSKWMDLYLTILTVVIATCATLVAVPLLLMGLFALAKKLLLGA